MKQCATLTLSHSKDLALNSSPVFSSWLVKAIPGMTYSALAADSPLSGNAIQSDPIE
ncbi:MAG TPA: hypothetical protein VFM46_07995 [Pseudomonadales bacterium]|nr:hypothetical protein [Pseudomonadales bacterium]